ncbi:hypothetical protein [Pedobacter panaciterrae]|jgi:hypothetical protein|uniref:Uncharacterized protein n=1 Tax=Pedobacter panaciterrae TaxID=363849 RepID=A0ABU8NJP3_9SPHI|nr:hypothetical protein [Pedobacter panaciterrae]NQX56099.1 hypothetical protein [Pedobacter panaciterrae]
MKFTIVNPTDHTPVRLRTAPEDYNGEQGLRIIFPENDSLVMVEKNGQWNVMDETDINPKLIEAIAKELKPIARYT